MSSARRQPLPRGLRPLLALAATLLLASPAGAVTAAQPATAAAPHAAFSGTIAPGVHVGNIDLSGLDETAARQVLTTAFAFVGTGQVNVLADNVATAISYASINRRVDIETLIAEAFAVGRTGSTMSRLVAMVHTVSNGMSLEPAILYDENALTLRVNQIAASSKVATTNARILRTRTGWNVTTAKPGRIYDASAALPQLIAQLYDPNAASTVSIALAGTDVQATITNDKAQAAYAKAIAMDQDIILANSGETWTIPQSVVHPWISFKYVDGQYQPVLNDALIQKALTAAAKDIDRAPISASWQYGPKGVVVVPAKNGRTMDIPKTARRIALFLQGRADGSVAPDKKLGPTVSSTPPQVTTAEAEKQAS
jgi:vancomycin resistance protein YoaR